MSIRTGLCLLAGLLIILTASCAKLPERPMPEDGEVQFLTLSSLESIPAEWGELEAVSNNSGESTGHIFHLWFQDDAGTIRVAFYNVRTNQLQTEGRIIKRSGQVAMPSEEDGS